MKKYSVLLWLFSLSIISNASEHFRLKIHMQNLTDKEIYLATYYGNSYQMVDTADVDKQGYALFYNRTSIPEGVYYLVLPNHVSVEFLLPEKQDLELSLNAANPGRSLLIKGSKQSETYADYLTTLQTKDEILSKLRQQIIHDQLNDSIKYYRDKLEKTNEIIDSIVQDGIQQYPGSILKSYFQATVPVKNNLELLRNKKNLSDSIIWLSSLRYMQQHYLDNVNLADCRLLHTPILSEKIENYFDRIIPQDSASVCYWLNIILEKADSCNELKNFITGFLLSDVGKHTGVEYEKIYVYIARKYYLSNPDSPLAVMEKGMLKEKVNSIEAQWPGHRFPNLLLNVGNDQSQQLSDLVKKQSILIIWQDNCNVCNETINLLKSVTSTQKNQIITINENGQDNKQEALSDAWIQTSDTGETLANNYHWYIPYLPVAYIVDEHLTIKNKLANLQAIKKFFQNEQ